MFNNKISILIEYCTRIRLIRSICNVRIPTYNNFFIKIIDILMILYTYIVNL